jgi:predicted acylesterase/phospholipase RssA
VCREHERASKFSDLKKGPVCICSHHCSKVPTCLVCDAARATSAAPTYFPVSKIGNRYFVDGGMKYNNPSRALYSHLDQARRVEVSKRTYTSPHTTASSSRHGDLDFSYARYVNLGTGTQTSASPKRRREAFAKFVPGFIRMVIFLKETLQEIAVESETVALDMAEFEYLTKGDIKYVRFSAGNGVCWIKLDKYREISKIEKLTQEYIRDEKTQHDLKKVASEIARDYYTRHLAEASQPATSQTHAGLSHGLLAPGASTLHNHRLSTHTPTSAASTSRHSGSSVIQDGTGSPPSVSTGDQVEPESDTHPSQPMGLGIAAAPGTKTQSPDSNTTQTTLLNGTAATGIA